MVHISGIFTVINGTYSVINIGDVRCNPNMNKHMSDKKIKNSLPSLFHKILLSWS